MDAWIPLIKEFIWPVFWAAALLSVRRPLGRLLKAVEERILAGAEFEAGATGIKVGAAPKLAEVTSITARTETASDNRIATETLSSRQETSVKKLDENPPAPRSIYLVHVARRDRALDKNELAYYRVRIYLDADEPALLDDVARVIYFLHPTFINPIRVISDRKGSFEVNTIVWGEFNVAARVEFKNGHDEELERYLNL